MVFTQKIKLFFFIFNTNPVMDKQDTICEDVRDIQNSIFLAITVATFSIQQYPHFPLLFQVILLHAYGE